MRREIFLDKFKASINFQNEPPIKDFYDLIDDTSNSYNQEKNQALVKAVCKSYNILLYEIPDSLYLNLDIDKYERLYLKEWHQTVANWFLEQSSKKVLSIR